VIAKWSTFFSFVNPGESLKSGFEDWAEVNLLDQCVGGGKLTSVSRIKNLSRLFSVYLAAI
jgi:hypothetical protein